MTTKEYIKNILPDYYKENDLYKDENGEGLFNRIIDTLADDIDDELIPFANNLVTSVISFNNFTYNRIISIGLGNIFYLINDEITVKFYRSWIKLNHLKGTLNGLNFLIEEILWLDLEFVDVTEFVAFYWDSELLWDSELSYWDNICPTIINYKLNLTIPDDYTPPYLQDIIINNIIQQPYIKQIVKLITFMQPVNTQLMQLNYEGVEQEIEDSFYSGFNDSFGQ